MFRSSSSSDTSSPVVTGAPQSAVKMPGTLPRLPRPNLPRTINIPSLPRGVTFPSLPRGLTMPSLPRVLNLPRELSLPRGITMPTVPEGPRRLLRGFTSVFDHQALGALCGCCGAFRPRYKRLVDNIFPENPEEGLVRSNMEKLTFYALSAPEKLDRIGAYLSERLARDVARHRYNSVCIAMEALDQLLMACHCQSINLFVESFLTMVRKLLESERPNLQILGTNSFVKFANIEEDTASYHRSYDFFVSRFSQMCQSNHEELSVRTQIRLAGIRGLQGVVRKTVNDELQVNIWEAAHMDQIIPSLLFNLLDDTHTDSDKDSPVEQTERCFRELLGRAAYGHITNAIRPVLMHLDSHSLWEEQRFAVRCFHIIMYSIQSQHSHLVIQQLVGHLDSQSRTPASVRAGIVEVLSEAAAIEAAGSVGPTVLEVFNTLLRQLRQSVDYQLTGCYDRTESHMTTAEEEKNLQEAVIKTIGSFANTLPVYQRSEVMLFIMGKIPVPGIIPALGSPNSGIEGSRMIQVMLLKSLLQVSEGYNSTNMLTALPTSFLEPLLSFTLMEDPEIQLLVLFILTSLIDRHHNTSKLQPMCIISDLSELNLKIEKCSRQDSMFMRKHAQRLYRYVYLVCREEGSGRSLYQALYTLLALLSVELANDEVLLDLLRLALALQDLATEGTLTPYSRCALHALVGAYLNFLSHLTATPAFCQHVAQVIDKRQKEMPCLLPEGIFTENPSVPDGVSVLDQHLLFVSSCISEAMRGNYCTERLCIPYTPQLADEEHVSRRKSIGDVASLQIESQHNPDTIQKSPVEHITFETLKSAIDSAQVEEEERERRRQVAERFHTAPFEEIAALCGAKTFSLHSQLEKIFEISIRTPPSPPCSTPLYDMKFPDLCVY